MKKPLDSDRPRGIDLHIHSNASDGTISPLEIIAQADQLGLRAIAITDHDSLEGSRQAIANGIPDHIKFLTGVEISTQAPSPIIISGSLHILGYDIDLNNGPLQEALITLQQARQQRTPQIIAQLQKLGIPITEKQVEAEVGQGTAGRPHIATVLIRLGVAASVDEAFDKYLSKGRPGYVNKYRINCGQAIELIRAAGGVPVLAHPFLLQQEQVPMVVEMLSGMGLEGIEAYYSQHSPEAVDRYLDLARQHKLLVTGGSDFHGDITPEIRMGSGLGHLFVPFELYEAIKNRHDD